jgi:hypothetical protein
LITKFGLERIDFVRAHLVKIKGVSKIKQNIGCGVKLICIDDTPLRSKFGMERVIIAGFQFKGLNCVVVYIYIEVVFPILVGVPFKVRVVEELFYYRKDLLFFGISKMEVGAFFGGGRHSSYIEKTFKSFL